MVARCGCRPGLRLPVLSGDSFLVCVGAKRLHRGCRSRRRQCRPAVQSTLSRRFPCVRARSGPPKGHTDRPRPAVIVIHGGGWIEGDKSSFDVQRTPGNIIDFAAAGFVAATVNYRLSREAPFPAGLHDCQAAVRWMRAHAREGVSPRPEPHRGVRKLSRRSSGPLAGTARALRAVSTNGADRFPRNRAGSRPSSATAVRSISLRSTRMGRSAR